MSAGKEEEGWGNRFLNLVLRSAGVYKVGIGSLFALELDDNVNDQFSNKRHYEHLNIFHRIFLIVENPSSCLLGKLWSLSVAVITLLSVIVYVLASLPELNSIPQSCADPVCNNDPELCPGKIMCRPDSVSALSDIENACLYVFIIDYFIRFFLVSMMPSHAAGVAPKPIIGSDEAYLDDCVLKNLEPALTKHSEELDALRLLMKEMNDRDAYWEEMERQSKKSLLKLIYVSICRPIRQTDYHPAQDPVYSWSTQLFRYTTKVMNLIDLVAILPFFISLSNTRGASFSVVRVLRLARVLRILKLGKGSKGMVILIETLQESAPALFILGFFSMIGVVLLGAIQYFCEGGTFMLVDSEVGPTYYRENVSSMGKEPTPFMSIPASMYWVVITSTTVGFGDMVPTSYSGRLLAMIAAYVGMFVLALPISVIGNNFERIYDTSCGHLSYGVVFGVLELLSEKNDIRRLLTQDLISHKSAAEKNVIVIKVFMKKMSAMFIIAHGLLSPSRRNVFMKALQDMHVHVYIDALIFIEEESRHQAHESSLVSPIRTIDPVQFVKSGADNPYHRSRDLLISLGVLPQGVAVGHNRPPSPVLVSSRVSVNMTQAHAKLEQELERLRSQIEAVHRALEACVKKHPVNSNSHSRLSLLKRHNNKSLDFIDEVSRRKQMHSKVADNFVSEKLEKFAGLTKMDCWSRLYKSEKAVLHANVNTSLESLDCSQKFNEISPIDDIPLMMISKSPASNSSPTSSPSQSSTSSGVQHHQIDTPPFLSPETRLHTKTAKVPLPQAEVARIASSLDNQHAHYFISDKIAAQIPRGDAAPGFLHVEWYPGIISGLGDNDTYDILLDDGTFASGISSQHIRIREALSSHEEAIIRKKAEDIARMMAEHV